jgi:hypothetical protein
MVLTRNRPAPLRPGFLLLLFGPLVFLVMFFHLHEHKNWRQPSSCLTVAALNRSHSFFNDRLRFLIITQASEFRVPEVIDLRFILHLFVV